jgi:hypothetical protein
MPGMAEPIVINTTVYELARAREEALGIFGSLDAGRPNAWGQYGYKTSLVFADFLQAYERGGAGHGAVHRILDKCWQERPRIKAPEADEETPWETKLSALLTGINAWQKLRDFDRRNMVGKYAGLIYRVADGKALREPLQRASELVDLIPVYEDQIKVAQWDADEASPRYGQPVMWQYRMRRPGGVDTQGAPDTWADVHWTRVQILAEGSVGDFLDGVPLLKAGFNSLVDLEKITGGSAESFLKNSSRTLHFKFDPTASPQVITQNPDGTPGTSSVREVIEGQTRALNRNQDSSIVTQGADVNALQTTVSDPEPAWQVAACMFAASVQIPFTALFGQQTGRLASDEDKADMVARCKSRQTNELTPMLVELVTRLQAAGIVETGAFEIEWPPLDSPGDDAKATLLGKMTAAMKQAFDSGLAEPLFDANELRGVLDYEERADDGLPGEGSTPLDDPQLDPVLRQVA